MLTGNTGGVLLAANKVTGPLVCSANRPGVDDTGRANVVSGPRTGQCAAL